MSGARSVDIPAIVRSADAIQGWMAPEELEWLATQASQRLLIVEIGSWKGRSTKALAMATSGLVIAIDHWLGSEGERSSSHKEAVEAGRASMMKAFVSNLEQEIKAGKVLQIVGDSVESIQKVKAEAAARNVDVDMVFIDGDHSYAGVRRDIEACLPLLRNGGLICGHDYADSTREVILAVHDLLGRPETLARSIWSFIVRR